MAGSLAGLRLHPGALWKAELGSHEMGYVGEDISMQSAAEAAWLLLMLTVKTKERGMTESRNGSSK